MAGTHFIFAYIQLVVHTKRQSGLPGRSLFWCSQKMASVRSKNTVDLRYCTTAQTRDDHEYVMFYMPQPVQPSAVRVVAVDKDTQREIQDPFFHCAPVSRAYPRDAEQAMPPHGPVTEVIVALKYSSNMHKRNVVVYATS